MYINEYTATKNTIQEVLRSHDRPVSLENLVHELRQRVPNYLILFPKKELLVAYIASVLKKEIASCCIYDTKRKKTIPRYFLRNSRVAKAIGVTGTFHPAVDGVSAFADAMFSVYNGTDNTHVAFSDVKKLYKKRTGRALTNGELNSIAGTAGVTRMNVLRDHLSHLVTVVNDHFEQVSCPAFYGTARDFFETQIWPEKYNPTETARVRELFKSFNEAAANDAPEEIDVDEDEGEITLADIKVNESFNASTTSYESSDMSAGLDQSLLASAEPPSPRPTSGDLASSGLATIQEDDHERQAAKDREFAEQAALLVEEREARLAAEADAAKERERIAAEVREREERERKAFEELERVRQEEEEQQRQEAERLEAEKREQEAEEKRQRELKEEEERKRLAAEKLEREAEEKRERQRKEKEERDRKAAEKRQREAAEKRERELKEEAERKRLENEKREREVEAERKRLETEKLELKAAAERKRLEDEKREREAERKRLEAEAAQKREQERKAEEERKRLEAEKLERDAAAERKRLEAEKLEREAAAERKRLEAEAEEKRQREAAEKREQERKAEEERKRLEAEKLEREAAAERKRLEDEKRELEAAAERMRLEAEKLEREAEAERKRLEAEAEEKRQREAAQKREQERKAEEERQRLEKEKRDREAEEKRQREAAEKRERELKEEAERKRLENEKREREAEAERKRLEAEKLEREAAAERKRLEDEKRELEAAAERKRLEAEAEEKRQREAAEKREQERKAEEERQRLEKEKREREAAAERKRLEDEKRELEAAAERKRLEAEAEEKRQREAAEKREQERKAEEKRERELKEEAERKRRETEKREREAAKKLERKRKEQEARDRKAAEKRERERKEKEERDAAEQLKAAQKLQKEEEERERAAATKRENEAAEERKRLEASQRGPIAVEVDSTSRLGSQSSPLHIVEQLSPRYDPSDTEAINDYAQSHQTGSESSSPKPNSDVLFAHMREELIEKHAAHSVASYGSTSNGMAVSDFSPLPQAYQRDSVFGETSGRTDSPVQKLNPSSDLEYAQFGIRRSAPRASDSTRATVASSSTSSMSLDVDNTQASDGVGEFSYSQAVSQLQSADAADNASDSLSMEYNELAAAPLRATRLFGLSAGNGSESSPQVSPTNAVSHHDHTVDSVTYADAVKEDATQALSDASVGSGTSSPNRRQRQDTVVDFSYVEAANPDRTGTEAAEDSFGSSNGDKENVPVHHDHVVVDLSYAEAAKLDGTVEEGVKQSVAAPLGTAPSENELESVVVTSPGEDQAFEHHDHVTSTLSYAGAVKHAAPEAGDVNDPELENEIYTDKPFDNYLILRLLTGFEHGIIKSLDSESLPAFFRDYVEQDIDPVQTWNLTWENVVDNWGKLGAFDYRDGVLYPNEATKTKASAHDEAGCGDCEMLTRTDAEIAASISQFHGSEAQFEPRFNDDDDYDVHSVYEDEIVPFSTDIEPIPKCDAMKDDEVHTGPKSCLTIRTPKSKTAASRVDQTGEVAPVNFSSSTSPKSTQPKHNGQPTLQKAAELQEVALKAPPPTPSEYVVNEDNDVFLPGDEQEHPQHGEHERSGLNCFHLPRFSTKSKNGSSSSNKSPVDKNASVVVPMEPEPVSVVVDEEDPETAPTTGTANELLDASGAAATTADNSAADDDLEDGNRAVGISRRYCKCCTII